MMHITQDELDYVRSTQKVSGMWMSGGRPFGDPAAEVARLARKYGVPDGFGLDLKDGCFKNRRGEVWSKPAAAGQR